MRRSAVLASSRAASITADVEVVFDPDNPGDTTLHATIRPMGLSSRLRERLTVLTPAAADGTLDDAAGAELLGLMVEALRMLVAKWDLTDENDQVIPLTAEALGELGLDEVAVLYAALMEAATTTPFVETSGPSKQ